ncbi:MAG: hypothetical protein ABI119_03560 [Gemmatimonadaceae bacterium]
MTPQTTLAEFMVAIAPGGTMRVEVRAARELSSECSKRSGRVTHDS